MTEHQALFCPFCREGFEALTSCPDHALRLVPFEQLAPSLSDEDESDPLDPFEMTAAPDDRPVTMLDPRRGRGLVALGALLAGVALVLDLATLGGRMLRTYQVAAALPSLWTLLLVGFCGLFVLGRRRTPRGLRSLRVLVPSLGVVVALTLALSLRRLGTGVLEGPAGLTMIASAVLFVVGGVRLGGSVRTLE